MISAPPKLRTKGQAGRQRNKRASKATPQSAKIESQNASCITRLKRIDCGLWGWGVWSPRANQDAMLPDVEEQRLHCILLPLLLHFPTVSEDS